MSYLSKSEIRRNPDSEEAAECARQNERDVFAAQMQYKFDHKLPPFDDEESDVAQLPAMETEHHE